MNEMFLFITQFALAYLLLGGLVAGFVALSLQLIPLNAAARHKIWLTTLLLIVLAPLLTLLPETSSKNTPAVPVALEPISIDESLAALSLEHKSVDSNFPVEFSLPAQQTTLQAAPGVIESLSLAIERMPLFSQFSIFLFALLLLGVASKAVFYFRSLIALRELIDSSEAVEGEWLAAFEACSAAMDLSGGIKLLSSSRLSTPSTCGILQPCIILPSTMLENNLLVQARAQVLHHELAHIKRRDPLVAGLQAVISIFLFWHPAINFVNGRIRFEREVACDDWVVGNRACFGDADVRAYAFSIVDIAESLHRKPSLVHSLACVDGSAGLAQRIRTMLNKGADHSTSVRLLPNLFVASIALGCLLFSSELLPRVPDKLFLQAPVFESPAIASTPPASTSMPIELLEPVLDEEEVNFSIDLGDQEIASVETPMPIPAITPNIDSDESNLVRARAERIKSSFGSRGASLSNSLAIEAIEPLVQQEPISELLLQDAGRTHRETEVTESFQGRNNTVAKVGLSKTELAQEIINLEIELYRLFNSMTERADLKMNCGKEIVLGSYIKQTICEPEFIRAARSEHLRGTLGRQSPKSLRQQMESEYAELAAEIVQALKQNPDLLEIYQHLVGLRSRLGDTV